MPKACKTAVTEMHKAVQISEHINTGMTNV